MAIGSAIGTGSAIIGGIGGLFGGGITRDPNKLCPGTPRNLIELLARRFEANPQLARQIRRTIEQTFQGEEDLKVARPLLNDPAGLAQAAVWLTWGGADCKTGTKEPPVKNTLRRIAREDIASTDETTSSAGLKPGVGLSDVINSPALLIGAVIIGFMISQGKN